jgi:hypothetical protein
MQTSIGDRNTNSTIQSSLGQRQRVTLTAFEFVKPDLILRAPSDLDSRHEASRLDA